MLRPAARLVLVSAALGINAVSRWGVRGSESLGSDLKLFGTHAAKVKLYEELCALLP